MILKRIKVPIKNVGETNCYILIDIKEKQAMVIDPAGKVNEIAEILDTLDVNLKYIYLTHCHIDHINSTNELKKIKGGKVLIHRNGRENLINKTPILAEYVGLPVVDVKEDAIVDDEDILHVGNIELRVIHTPGHTNDGTSLYCEKERLLFSGDTLFKGAWGRVDLPTSSFKEIMNSIMNKLLILPEETIVYPGHGDPTRIGDERPIYLEAKPKKD